MSLADTSGLFSDDGLLVTDGDYSYPDQSGIREQAESEESAVPWNNGTSDLDSYDFGCIDPRWLFSDGAGTSTPGQAAPGQGPAGASSVDGSQVAPEAL